MAAGDSNPKGKRASKTTSKIENTFKNNENLVRPVKGGLAKNFKTTTTKKKRKLNQALSLAPIIPERTKTPQERVAL